MNIHDIVERLREELAGIQNAIAILTGSGSQQKRRGRPPKSSSASGGKKRTMSASARAKISAAQKARWAKQKVGSRKNG